MTCMPVLLQREQLERIIKNPALYARGGMRFFPGPSFQIGDCVLVSRRMGQGRNGPGGVGIVVEINDTAASQVLCAVQYAVATTACEVGCRGMVGAGSSMTPLPCSCFVAV